MFVWSLTYRWVVSDRLSSNKRSEEDPHQLVSYSMSIVKDNFEDQSSVAVVFTQKRLFRRFFDKRRDDTNDQTFIFLIYFSRNPTRAVERNLESIGDTNHRKIALFPHQQWFHNCPPRFCPYHGLDSQGALYYGPVVCRTSSGSFPRLFPNFLNFSVFFFEKCGLEALTSSYRLILLTNVNNQSVSYCVSLSTT